MHAHWEGPDYSRKAILDVPSSYESVLRLAAEKTSPRKVLVRFEMATEPKAAAENVKIDLFEDDDEFEINEVGIVIDCQYPINVQIYEFANWNYSFLVPDRLKSVQLA
ncbi:hypothetical protein CK203_006635 [Vitis vinifera]|uniref:Uncharacterized protein n=1 Tax=Vitis vinifera TaxID=29760 RepID=A0A438KAL4_VITVI|nr:hypothetical protein CK203_006635 [Vitis vinifera]